MTPQAQSFKLPIQLRWHKTRPKRWDERESLFGKGQSIAILAQSDSPYCPVTAMNTWLTSSKISNGAVFRRFYRGDSMSEKKLGDRAIAELIKDSIYKLKDPSLNFEHYSGHSLRRGFLTSASQNKADIFKLISQSRHKNLDTLMAYVADQDRFESHAAAELLLT